LLLYVFLQASSRKVKLLVSPSSYVDVSEP
jgi:hypothetical protein